LIVPRFIPGPPVAVWHLGPFPIRAYALCILAGIGVAVWMGERRWVARGGTPGVVESVSVWVVPFGIVGGRLYHVVTDPSSTSSQEGTRGTGSRSGTVDWVSGVRFCLVGSAS
jgi:prolipoprotein diacylglyceryltransferase